MMDELLVLGIDAGGTSTRAVLTDLRGACRGYGVAGRGNPISAGHAAASEQVIDAAAQALHPSGASLADVSTIVPAMAGMRAFGGVDWLAPLLRARGFAGTVRFESDLLATYFSGATAIFGYALVSGTGACAIRVSDGLITATRDGLGWLLGDRGSGFWIGQAIARAAVHDLDGTGPRTGMTDRLLQRHGLARTGSMHDGRPEELEALVGRLYDRAPIELAALATIAFDEKDDVARGILAAAGEHLADTLASVLEGGGPLVVGGSVLARPGPVQEAFLARLGSAGDALELRPVADGAVGAAVLAIRASGGRVCEEVRERLTQSIGTFR